VILMSIIVSLLMGKGLGVLYYLWIVSMNVLLMTDFSRFSSLVSCDTTGTVRIPPLIFGRDCPLYRNFYRYSEKTH
jgi:hypothetical protein